MDETLEMSNTSLSSSGSCYIESEEPSGYRPFRFAVDVCIVGLLCTFGFIGNSLCITVLHRDKESSKEKTATNWLLRALALSDTLYLIACVLFQCINGLVEWSNEPDWLPSLSKAWTYMKPYAWGFPSIAQTITVWLVNKFLNIIIGY